LVLGEGVYSSGLFELGDGQPPPGMPGLANIAPNPLQNGPDWADLFSADGSPKDEYPLDGEGNPLGNGVPDYRELFGGRWAIFEADYVSLGSGFDGTVRAADGGVKNGTVAAVDDIGNSYVYEALDPAGNVILYGAVERLADGDTTIEFEFNQGLRRLGHGGYGKGIPWKIEGQPQDNDVTVTLRFAAGQLAAIEASKRVGEAWQQIASVFGEGCDANESLCAVGNEGAIDAGPWPNFDGGSYPGQISPHRFAEFGINVGVLLGAQPRYRTVLMRTPGDASFGYFGEDQP
jgi:hypothetical protein